MSEYRDLVPVIVERERAMMPEGFDSWGIKSVSLDRRTHGDYKWPHPGHVAECDPERVLRANKGACPERKGDGLCVATSWAGMASGSQSARLILLVAYASGDVLGRDDDAGKLRTTRVAVVAQVDGERLLREEGRSANLYDADLRDADLYSANLRGASLHGANLHGATASEYTIWPKDFDPKERGVAVL